jgi:hypothetical protein
VVARAVKDDRRILEEPMMPSRRHLAARTALAAIVLLAACSTSGESSPDPASPGASAPPSGAPSDGSSRVVVTFQVGGEEYRVLLTDPSDIEIARRLLAGEEAPRIPNGVIVRGDDGGVNTGYSWHIDPESVEFAEMTIEVCDGLPSFVEAGTLTGDRFCPWAAEVIAIDE